MASASCSRKWHWVMEYLLELKDLETSLVKDMIHNVPNFWCDVPEGSKERLCLRYLEQSLEDGEDGQSCIPFASPPIVGRSVDLKKGMSSEAVLSRLLRKKAVTLHDPEKHVFEFSRKDVQLFVQRQKEMLPKKCLDLIEESIVQGQFPVNLDGGAEAENHCRNRNAEFEAVHNGSFKTSGKFMPQKRKMASPAGSTDKTLTQQDEASKCRQPLIDQNCIDSRENAELDHTHVTTQNTCSKQLDERSGDSRQHYITASRDKDACIDRRESAEFDETCVSAQIACFKQPVRQSCDSWQVSLPVSRDKDVCIDRRENAEFDDTCVAAQITCSKQLDKQICDSRQVSLNTSRDEDVCIEVRENAVFDDTCVTAQITSSKHLDKQSCDSRQVSLTVSRDKDVCVEDWENAKFDDTRLIAQIASSKQSDSRQASLTAIRDKDVCIDSRENAEFDDTCLTTQITFSEQPDKQSCDSRRVSLTTSRDKVVGEKVHLDGREVVIPHVPSPWPPDGNANPVSDLMEESSCIKCGKSGIMLSCSACFITVHEGCLASAANVGETGCFCCPWCSYNKAREEHDRAKEIFSRAKEKFSQAKDVLANFIKSNVHEDALPSPGPRREECPAAAPPSSIHRDYDPNTGESAKGASQAVIGQKDQMKVGNVCISSSVPFSDDAHTSMEVDHGGEFLEGREVAKVIEVASWEEHQLSLGIHAVCNNEDLHLVDSTANNGLLNRRANENPRPQSGCISLKDETSRDIVLFAPRENHETGNIGLHKADGHNTSPKCINRDQKRRKLVDGNSEGLNRLRPISVNQAKENPSFLGHMKFRPLFNRTNPVILAGRNHQIILGGRRNKLDWSSEEEEYLKSAVGKLEMKEGDLYPWTHILESGRRVFHDTRKPSDLRIKWRNILQKESPGRSNISKGSPDAS